MRVDQSVRQALLSLPRLALCDHPETVSVIQELVVESSLATGLELRTLHSGLESSEESLATACLVSPQAQHVFIVLHPGQSALCLAAEAGHHHILSLLLQCGARLDQSAVVRAARAGHLQVLEFLLLRGQDWSKISRPRKAALEESAQQAFVASINTDHLEVRVELS